MKLPAWAPVIIVVSAGFAACGTKEKTSGAGGQSAATTASSSASGATISASSSASGGPLTPTFDVSGFVVDRDGAPVAGATVMQGGGTPSFTTGPDGAFKVTLTTSIPGVPTVIAAKIGYRSDGNEFYSLPIGPTTLVLKAANPPDNVAYAYGDPGTGVASMDNSTKYCGHCHTRFVADFVTSAHAAATNDPWVQDLYAGVASAITTQAACTGAGGKWLTGLTPGQPAQPMAKCYVGAGVLPDLNTCGTATTCDDPSIAGSSKPTHFGQCADCHAGGMSGPVGGRNLHDATGVSFKDGNHCDFCHHIRDVDTTSSAPGVAGRLILQRPSEKTGSDPLSPTLQVMFGPFPDVPNVFMGGSPQPKFKSSDLCSGCHEYNQSALLPGATLDAKWPNGVPALSTYSEWTNSPSNPSKTCQSCHMPVISGMFNALDVSTPDEASIAFGFGPRELHSHVFLGPLDGMPRLTDSALTGSVAAMQTGSTLGVDVKTTNTGAGHAIPTSEPMRSLVLVVRADGCGQSFTPNGGLTIPDFGGSAASATVGNGVSFAGATVVWPQGAAVAKVGDSVRVVRSSGMYVDYPGVGYFGTAGLTPQQKGMPQDVPVGEADVVAVNPGTLLLSGSIPVAAGDVVTLGDPWPLTPADGDPSRALAGASGFAFARVMVDPNGARFIPHYRAVNVASDNRLPPGVDVHTSHTFAIPVGCTSAHVTATVLYRPAPVGLERQRSWGGQDFIVLTSATDVTLQ